ncbi:MAG: hypothetical protein AB2693_32800 [Candidatus Thiodiazotropha sp.]
MSDALEEHEGNVRIGGRIITNLRFADEIHALDEEERELEDLVESLDKTCTVGRIKFGYVQQSVNSLSATFKSRSRSDLHLKMSLCCGDNVMMCACVKFHHNRYFNLREKELIAVGKHC